MKKNTITLQDIADAMGVSRALVSLCLSGKYCDGKHRVSETRAAEIRAYADQIGYIPNYAARKLRTGARPPVGILFNLKIRAGEKSFPAMSLAEEMLHDHEFETQVVGARDIASGLEALMRANCRDVIVLDTFTEQRGAEDLCSGLPRFVDAELFRANFSRLNIHAVDYDFPAPAAERLEQVHRLGVDRFGFQCRLIKAFQAAYGGTFLISHWRGSYALETAGSGVAPWQFIPYDEICPTELFDSGVLAVDYFLEVRKYHPVRTVFWGDDRLAAGFCAGLTARGIRIPEEVQVIGFDNLEFTRYLAIPLTTWGVPILANTRVVLESLIAGNDPPSERASLPDVTWGASAVLPDGLKKQLMQER